MRMTVIEREEGVTVFTHLVAEAVFGDHGFGQSRCLHNIRRCTTGDDIREGKGVREGVREGVKACDK